jgi:hypothetical protein
MGDLTRGETFADGEVVDASRLHKLVDEATLNAGAVDTATIADGAVTSAKLADTLSVQASQVLLPEASLLIGGPAGKGIPIPPGPEMTVGATFGIAAQGVGTAKIADGAVTGAKLAAISPSPAGEWGDAVNVPVLTVDATGRVTAAREVSIQAPGLVIAETLTQKPVVWGPGVTASWAHTLGTVPTSFLVWLVCVLDTVDTGNPSTEAHFKVGDIIPLWTCFFKEDVTTWPAFSCFANATRVEVTAFGQGGLFVMARSTAIPVDLRNMLNNFRFAGSVMKVS